MSVNCNISPIGVGSDSVIGLIGVQAASNRIIDGVASNSAIGGSEKNGSANVAVVGVQNSFYANSGTATQVIRAVTFVNDVIANVPDALVGTGTKYFVYHNGRLKNTTNVADGAPVVMVNGRLRILKPGESLEA